MSGRIEQSGRSARSGRMAMSDGISEERGRSSRLSVHNSNSDLEVEHQHQHREHWSSQSGSQHLQLQHLATLCPLHFPTGGAALQERRQLHLHCNPSVCRRWSEPERESEPGPGCKDQRMQGVRQKP
uniref:HDC18555 n=1 Tax=Drosophila melanogaster TaxID=7227 RepID=Q6IIE6_DROME|nr:TPA_inf: HDC18555 [Drosophila melanogaster]